MNYTLLSRVFGALLLMLSAAMLCCVAFAWWEMRREVHVHATEAFLISFAITFGAGLLLSLKGWNCATEMLRKEAVVVVGGGWIISALFGALPYVFSSPGLSFVHALFESMSGFTTTGSTVIAELQQIPHAILLWRSLTQWLGGLGILVLFVALLSHLGVGGKSLFRLESSARVGENTAARIKDTAKIFCFVYLALSGTCLGGLLLLGMTPFDAICHAMTTVATGGFSTHNESIAYFESFSIEIFLTVMMVLSSLSFFLYVAVVRRDWARLKAEEEAKFFLLLVAGSTLAVVINLTFETHVYENFGEAARGAIFQVASIVTTTGFASEDYDQWPGFAMALLLVLMVFGGCAGSTAGGIKMSRVLLFSRIARQEIITSFRPRQIFALNLNGSPAEGAARTVPIYIAMFGVVIPIGALTLALLEPGMSFDTCLSATLATLFNVGPGFGAVGPTQTFADFGAPACLVMTLLMALGRLELFAILVLFVPSLWRKF
ncbi:MAG: TrkH family potassium uptake protein [Verrucomicrobiales bacterium]